MQRLRRAAIALLAVVVLGTGTARSASTTNFTDQWWVPAESGWGAAVLQQADTLFIDLFVYGADGKPTWLVGAAAQQAGAQAGHAVFTGDLYVATAGPYYGAPFGSVPIVGRKAGTLTFDADSVTTATLSWTVDGTPVVKSVTRQLARYINLGGSYYGGTSGEQTSCGADNGPAEGQEFIDITHNADDTITVRRTDLQNRTRTITGAYAQSGHMGQIIGTITDPAQGLSGTAALFEIEWTTSGITGRGHVVFQKSGVDVCVWDGRWGGVRRGVETATLDGKVMDGRIEAAVVCFDSNGNARCDADEAPARSDAAGGYRLWIPKGATASLIAEVVAGVSRDAAQPGTTVDVSFRMASPSGAYSTNITPFTTLVHLSGRANLPLAEDIVRNELGLPPKFDIRPAAPPAAGSLTRAVGDSIVTALKATSAMPGLPSPGAFANVVAAFPPALTTLPTLRIVTKDGAPIVSRETYVDATFALVNPMVSDAPVALNGKIRGRGHSTWGLPKNPYKVQFASDSAYSKLADVLGMKKNRNWALLADWFDRSLLRNKLAYSLGSSSVFSDGLKWTPSGQHLEVFLNDDYIGVYMLTEDIRLDPARLDIRKMSKDPAVNETSGGYIVEVDQRLYDEVWAADCYAQGDISLRHFTPHGVPFCIDTPDEESITIRQMLYAGSFLDDVEADIYARKSVEMLNTASFADWYLLSELFRNQDAQFFSSVFMWKDSDTAANPPDRLLNLGPLWDFDRSAGNVNYDNNWLIEGCWVSKNYYGNWIAGAFENADFLNLTLARWQQKRVALADFINSGIDAYSRRLQSAQQRNFERWPILGSQLVNYYTFQTYAEEVAFVKSYLNQRLAWLDQAYTSRDSFYGLCR